MRRFARWLIANALPPAAWRRMPTSSRLFFTKENTSNGDIATVDVFFPMDPIWILLSPTLAKATLGADSFLCGFEPLEISQRAA